jgi:hypothetical protein
MSAYGLEADLTCPHIPSGELRFNSNDIQCLYDNNGYPPRRRMREAGLKSARILDLSALDVAMTATLSAYR